MSYLPNMYKWTGNKSHKIVDFMNENEKKTFPAESTIIQNKKYRLQGSESLSTGISVTRSL